MLLCCFCCPFIAAGAAAAAVFTQPAVWKGAVQVSLGASGAIFGLFAVSVLTRLSWDPRKLLEGAILGQFVVRQVFQEAKAQAAGGLVIGGLQVCFIKTDGSLVKLEMTCQHFWSDYLDDRVGHQQLLQT